MEERQALRAELEATRAELRIARQLVDAAPALMGYWDRDLRCRQANRAYLAWLGRPPEELLGKSMPEVLGPLFELNRPYVEGVLRGEAQQFERELPASNEGLARHCLAHYTPDIVDGTVVGFFVLATDISARRRVEVELSATEARFRAIFTASPLAITITEAGRFVAVNSAFEQVFGWTEASVLGRTASELGMFDHPPEVLERVARGAGGMDPRRIPMTVIGPDGTRRDALVSTAQLTLGARVSTISVAIDLTSERAIERELRASEARLRAIFEAVHDGLFIVDDHGVVVDANRGACQQLGLERAALIGMPISAISARPNFDPRPALAEVARLGFVAYETTHRRADGSAFPVDLVLSSLGDSGIVGIARDVTERHHVEAALRRSERRYRVLVENLPGMVAILVDRDLRIVLVDGPAMQEGFSKAQMEGQLLHDAVPASFAAAVEPNIRAGLAGRSFVVEIPWAEGITYRYEYCPLRTEQGEVEMVLILGQDISERARASAALAASELRFRTLSEASPVGVFYADVAGHNTYANARWAAITARGPAATLGDGWLAALEPADLARWRTFVAEGDELVLEAPLRVASASRWVKLRVARVRDAVGATLGLVGTLDDLTERRQHALDLEQRNDELTRFTYTVSHDLRSPLVTIKTFVGYLAQDLADGRAAKIEQDLGFIRTAADRMSRLLDELLELSRVGRKVHAPIEVSLRELVDEALVMVQGQIVATGARIDLVTPSVIVAGERVRLLEVFQNLIDNALKFVPPGERPRVEIGAELGGPEPVLFVRDHGIGIDPRYQHKLFGLFEKLDPAAPGTGIGLALVKRIIEVHGGRIWVDSAGVGHGATFRFTLPGTLSGGPT
ncbi:MAG: PAS domain S-box protein [Proteobacteria bacterium]|nr:PAS domain S-box protein [Pseudomonadota bacterium]